MFTTLAELLAQLTPFTRERSLQLHVIRSVLSVALGVADAMARNVKLLRKVQVKLLELGYDKATYVPLPLCCYRSPRYAYDCRHKHAFISVKCLDPGSGRKSPAIWHGAGANPCGFVPGFGPIVFTDHCFTPKVSVSVCATSAEHRPGRPHYRALRPLYCREHHMFHGMSAATIEYFPCTIRGSWDRGHRAR